MDIQIEEVKETMNHYLPQCWSPLEAALSVVGAAMLKDVDHCMGLILVGEPGGRKSTTIELLGRAEPFLKLDDFTPASFVSHDATKKEEQLKKVDLLPKVKHKIMLVPELAPLFGKRYEDLLHSISILTAVMDGKGYFSASGVQGRRGYEGDYRFAMICGTTPLSHRVWEALGKLSSRWIFYHLPNVIDDFIDLKQDYSGNVVLCRALVQAFISDFWKGYSTVDWDRLNDDDVWGTLINWSAWAVSKWRGLILQQDTVGYNPPIIEVPHRMRETLYALARGHALLWGKRQIDWDDVQFAIEINFTNMPEDRLRVFKAFDDALSKHIGIGGDAGDIFTVGISLRGSARAIGCSTDRAERVMNELIDLGVVRKGNIEVSKLPTISENQLYYRAV